MDDSKKKLEAIRSDIYRIRGERAAYCLTKLAAAGNTAESAQEEVAACIEAMGLPASTSPSDALVHFTALCDLASGHGPAAPKDAPVPERMDANVNLSRLRDEVEERLAFLNRYNPAMAVTAIRMHRAKVRASQ